MQRHTTWCFHMFSPRHSGGHAQALALCTLVKVQNSHLGVMKQVGEDSTLCSAYHHLHTRHPVDMLQGLSAYMPQATEVSNYISAAGSHPAQNA